MFNDILSRVQKVLDKPFLVVGGITLLGTLLRLYHLGFKPLWLDEAVLYWISNSGNVQGIIAQNASSIYGTPPLFAILLNLTLKIGDSETVLRFLPWLGGTAAIPAIYFLSRQFLERTPAYFSTLVVAIAPTQVMYSQQLREYSLTFLTATVILALFYQQLRRPAWNNWVLMTLALVLGIFLQYGLALLVVALNLVCAIELLSARATRKLLLLRWGAAQFVVLCAVVAVYYLSLRQQMTVGFGATSTVTYLAGAYWNGSLSSLLGLAVFNTLDIFAFTFPDSLFLFVAGVGFIITLRDRSSHIALWMFVLPVVLTFVTAFARLYPYQGDRQDMFLTPMIYVLAGFGFGYLLNVVQRRWVLLLLLLVVFVVGLRSTRGYLNYPGTENIRPIVNALSTSFEKGDKIYVYYAAKPAFTYYYRNHIDSQIYGTSSRGNANGYFQEIDNLLLSNARIWMVFSHCFANECELIPKHVSENRKVEVVASDNGAWLYLVH
jgi:uncharacterized membrane protein